MINQIPGENFVGPVAGKVGSVAGKAGSFAGKVEGSFSGGASDFNRELLSEIEALANSSDGVAMAKQGILKAAHKNGININNPGKDVPKGEFAVFDRLKTMSAEDIINILKKQISAKGLDLDTLDADRQSINELKELFKGLGFDEGEIEEITANFSGDTKLSDLFKNMSKLEKEEDDSTVLMDVSNVPFIKAIMTHLGVDEKQIEGLLSGTRVRSFGLDANKLLNKLNEFIAKNNYKTPVPGQFSQSQAHQLMERIDLSNSDFDGPITLAKFVAELRALVDTTMQDRTDNKNLNGKLDKFFDKIKVNKKALEKSASQFAKQQPGMIDGILGSANAGMIEGDLSNYAILEKIMENVAPQTEANDININMMRDKIMESLRDKEKSVDPTVLTDSMREARVQNDFQPVAPKGQAGKTLPAFVMEQVSKQLVKSVKKGQSELMIQIKPPKLGKLQLSLENASKGLRISIVAEHSATKEMLTSQIADLRNLIVEQGVNVDSIDVQINQNFDKNLAQQGNDFHSSKEKRSRMVQAAKSRAVRNSMDLPQQRGKVKRGSGNLDLVA